MGSDKYKKIETIEFLRSTHMGTQHGGSIQIETNAQTYIKICT